MASYGPLCTLFYDADKPVAPDAEVAWYANALPKDAGPLLEPMCGSGRLLIPLAERGFNLHGADNSAAMLASCEARTAARGLAARLFRQDVAQLNLPFRYAAAFVAAGSFQLLTGPGTALQALTRLRAHLIEPGLLIVDLFVPPDSLLRQGAPLVEVRTVRLADGSQIALRSESTAWPDAQLLHIDCRYAHRRGAERLAEEHERITLTWYTPETFTALLAEAGFRNVEVAASPRGEGNTDDGQAFAVTARA